jgi:hypothetical protein
MDRNNYMTEIAYRTLAEEFDKFVAACMDEKGDPKAPSYRELMKARGYLPPLYCAHALTRSDYLKRSGFGSPKDSRSD